MLCENRKDRDSSEESAWQENINQLQYAILNDDPREFLRWKVIRDTMFFDNPTYIDPELAALKSDPKWPCIWETAIQETIIGHPPPYYAQARSSGNLIHHAYHVLRFQQETGRHVNDFDVIIEFGGGYGSLCRLIHNLGFQRRYVIIDFPEFAALQTYFLESIGIPVNAGAKNSEERGVYFLSDIPNFHDSLCPKKGGKPNVLFIATWSLSEAPIEVRQTIMAKLGNSTSFLLAYQDEFEGRNNLDFFQSWQAELHDDMQWYDSQIDHLPNNYYLFGSQPVKP